MKLPTPYLPATNLGPAQSFANELVLGGKPAGTSQPCYQHIALASNLLHGKGNMLFLPQGGSAVVPRCVVVAFSCAGTCDVNRGDTLKSFIGVLHPGETFDTQSTCSLLRRQVIFALNYARRILC
jgi:hypothetical protein